MSTASKARTGRGGAHSIGKGMAKGEQGGRQGKAKGAAKRKKAPIAERLSAAMLRHPALSSVACALFVTAAAALIFWFTIFSGLDASADFVYSQF